MSKCVFITGGAGFIGFNAALHFLERGDQVVVFDNLCRPGAHRHIELLKRHDKATVVKGDIRVSSSIQSALNGRKIDLILHLASQVAVTTSIQRPREDFEINAAGTLNLLEAVRQKSPRAVLIYASTNKVYGELTTHRVTAAATRYKLPGQARGVTETQPLDFHSPYGCSKGAADQYVRDYHRIYGLRTAVFRQSCIYGPYQYGIEDQGWVAWLSAAALFGRPITVYGNGKQVRDLLYIDDLVKAYAAAFRRAQQTGGGEIYNIGGGPRQTLSVLELLDFLSQTLGRDVKWKFGAWRPGDQKVYISDIGKARRELGWVPQEALREGISKLLQWQTANRSVLEQFYRNL